ncbi:MAG: hypothetical protein LBQ91_02045, partial [Oscillospiraceae bacterium]|nr:hypothetical protein [Oscillospiraceae bacterium]
MTLFEVYRSVISQLRAAGIDACETEARIICSHFSGLSPERLLLLRNGEAETAVANSIAE